MRREALEYLACPHCGGALRIDAHHEHDGHVVEGSVACASCAAAYPILRGVPRFAGAVGEVETRTAEAFGYDSAWAAEARVQLISYGDATIEADPRSLREALLNLVANGIEATPPGDVAASAAVARG